MGYLQTRTAIVDLKAQYLTVGNARSVNLQSTIINHKSYRDWPKEIGLRCKRKLPVIINTGSFFF